ncbi:MAG: response regulator [Candidatus Auribacterota bacterium]|jgi:DNA-binding response OmpR family regulator|uniref:Response regulator n=1 Tax=Candidatus Auribacter fodinae TaxID=2093366 RepID=A0A3A4R3Y0_9BACT|nr:MAG: response regulator [Candidatus Auribacter fodinae]
MTKTILLTEDDQDVGDLIQSALESEGYEVVWVKDGVKAVEIIQDKKVDLILLDIMMPTFSGYWFCDVFKKNPQTKDIPIIFISALNSETDIKRGMDLGASAFLTKPFKMQQLFDMVASFLNT